MFNEKEEHTEAGLYGTDYKLPVTRGLMQDDSCNNRCRFPAAALLMLSLIRARRIQQRSRVQAR